MTYYEWLAYYISGNVLVKERRYFHKNLFVIDSNNIFKCERTYRNLLLQAIYHELKDICIT
jgi:hypothetical protein